MNFAINIKNIRISNNMTMKQFATKLGVTKSRINMWENGSVIPHVNILIKISQIYDYSIDFLVGNNKNKVEYNNG